ncbi:MAG: OmpA family protein [Alphaproteobacteria bacterium]
MTDDAKAEIKALAARMLGNPDIKVQLLAYAAGDDATASKARRMSLSRALSVRAFMMEQDISSSRIEVRAMGHKVREGPADRVDIVVTQR